MGRPRKTLPANGLQVIRDLASNGVQETVLAKALGISYEVWQRIREEDPEAKAAWVEAKKLEEDRLVGMLFEQAVEKKNVTGAIFLLKGRHAYRDIGPTDGSDAARIGVTINIPAPLAPEEYAKLINVVPEAREAA